MRARDILCGVSCLFPLPFFGVLNAPLAVWRLTHGFVAPHLSARPPKWRIIFVRYIDKVLVGCFNKDLFVARDAASVIHFKPDAHYSLSLWFSAPTTILRLRPRDNKLKINSTQIKEFPLFEVGHNWLALILALSRMGRSLNIIHH
jgi:hypothetical protein